jgi:uncharacterized membrane protein
VAGLRFFRRLAARQDHAGRFAGALSLALRPTAQNLQAGGNTKSHVWFRFYNEMPVLVMFVVLFLVVLKPF